VDFRAVTHWVHVSLSECVESKSKFESFDQNNCHAVQNTGFEQQRHTYNIRNHNWKYKTMIHWKSAQFWNTCFTLLITTRATRPQKWKTIEKYTVYLNYKAIIIWINYYPTHNALNMICQFSPVIYSCDMNEMINKIIFATNDKRKQSKFTRGKSFDRIHSLFTNIYLFCHFVLS